MGETHAPRSYRLKLNGREMKALFFLSIVVPVGLLTTLRLTGILSGPITVAETKTLETVDWEFQKPDNFLAIDKTLQVPFVQNGLSATFNLIVNHYDPNTDGVNYGEVSVGIKMNFTVANPHAFIEGVDVAFSMDNHSILTMPVTQDIEYDAENLSLSQSGHSWSHEGLNVYISFEGTGQPKSAYLLAAPLWMILVSSIDQTHQLDVAYTLTYYNGTAYDRVIQPFQIRVIEG